MLVVVTKSAGTRPWADRHEPHYLSRLTSTFTITPMSSPYISSLPVSRAATAVAAISLAACATTGSTFGSGVGDAFLEHPPYYAGAMVRGDSADVVHLPIVYQRGGSQDAMFDPKDGAGTPVGRLVAEMNAYLDSLGRTTPLAATPRGTPPDVRFGCVLDEGIDECEERDDNAALGRKGQRMKLAVGRPSADWTTATRSAMPGGKASRALLLTLEVGQYLPRQTGWRGDKSVEMGTAYTVELPWLTSLETPVSVVQLTGALVDTAGRAVRIGAEGMLARRTPFLVSALGAQALISDEDIEKLRTARREDLPGQPLVWQVAIRTLVAQLTGRSELLGG
jgi:hypothetical protein